MVSAVQLVMHYGSDYRLLVKYIQYVFSRSLQLRFADFLTSLPQCARFHHRSCRVEEHMHVHMSTCGGGKVLQLEPQAYVRIYSI